VLLVVRSICCQLICLPCSIGMADAHHEVLQSCKIIVTLVM
jgi:hypothetical protein